MVDEIYTEGVVRRNGRGASSYAVIVHMEDGSIKRYGEVFMYKSLIQMELLAVAKALQLLTRFRSEGIVHPENPVPIYTASSQLYEMFARKRIYAWEAQGRIDKHQNSDLLWMLLDGSYKAGKFRLTWYAGGREKDPETSRYCNELMDKYLNETN